MGTMIYDKYLGNETKIVVQDDSYIVEGGDDRIILPREVYVAKEALKEPGREAPFLSAVRWPWGTFHFATSAS